MKIGPLSFLKRMTCNGDASNDVLIAAWHPRASLTWRWSLTRGPYRPYNDPFYFLATNGGAVAGIRLPYIGNVHFQTQQFMLDVSVLPEMRRG